MSNFITPFLAFVAVVAIGGAVLIVRWGKKKVISERLSDVVSRGQVVQKVSILVQKLNALGKRTILKPPSQGLQEELARAGYHGANTATMFMGAKILAFLFGLIISAVLLSFTHLSGSSKLILVLGSAVGLFFVPNFVVSRKRKLRTEGIRLSLPNALDLLEICVSAGMGMDMAWNSVGGEIGRVSPILSDEMALTNLEMHLGASRSIAMKHMSERSGCEDLSALATVLTQSDRFGTSIADAVRTFAASLRELRAMRAQEAAEKMAIKLIVPMVVFIFPALLIVLAGPAIIRLNEMLSGK